MRDTDEQFSRLKRFFPDDVCNRSKRGVGQEAAVGVRRALVAIFACVLLATVEGRAAADTVTFEVMGGSALNLSSPLTVRQRGFPDIHLSGARYETRPFSDYPYAAWRIGLWRSDSAWELEHIHHRLFLTNPPPEIEVFAIHFGYNYFLLGRAWKKRGFVYRAGAGPIVTNPENTVRGQKFHHGPGVLDTGNFFSGIGARGGVARHFDFARHVFVVGEAAFSAGFAWRVPVSDGSANVPNFAVHGHLGLGFRF